MFLPIAANSPFSPQPTPEQIAFMRALQASQGSVLTRPMPVPFPVPVPQAPKRPAPKKKSSEPKAADIFGGVLGALPMAVNPLFGIIGAGKQLLGPQGQDEPDIFYGTRKLASAPARGVQNIEQDIKATVNQALDTPRKRAERAAQPAAGSVFPNSFRDPAYAAANVLAARQTGVPQQLLDSILLNGERSNANQVSTAGARTPYQITPETRQGIIKNYGFDPWSSPQNAALGAAYVLKEQGGNPQEWTPETIARAAGGYFGGAAGAANPFGTLSDGGTTVGNYVQRVLGLNTGLPAPFLNPYDPTGDRLALGQLNAAEAFALQPTRFQTPARGPAPEMPTPEPIPQTDFSKADAALEALRPIEMTEKDRLSRERDGWFKGLANALMRADPSDGLGTFFMRLGGATLGGRMEARDEIRAKQEQFEQKMAQFNAAVYSHEMGKAKVFAQEAQAQVQQNNAFAVDRWKVAYDQWSKQHSVDISGTNVISRSTDYQTGQDTYQVVPIAPAVRSAFAVQRAQQLSSMAGRQMGGNQLVASQANAFITSQAAAALAGGGAGAESAAALAAAPAFYATHVVKYGKLDEVLGPEGAASLRADVQSRLKTMGLMLGSPDYTERAEQMMAEELVRLGIADPAMMEKMSQAGGAADYFEATDRYYSRRERQATDAKGRRTSSVTYDSNYGE